MQDPASIKSVRSR